MYPCRSKRLSFNTLIRDAPEQVVDSEHKPVRRDGGPRGRIRISVGTRKRLYRYRCADASNDRPRGGARSVRKPTERRRRRAPFLKSDRRERYFDRRTTAWLTALRAGPIRRELDCCYAIFDDRAIFPRPRASRNERTRSSKVVYDNDDPVEVQRFWSTGFVKIRRWHRGGLLFINHKFITVSYIRTTTRRSRNHVILQYSRARGIGLRRRSCNCVNLFIYASGSHPVFLIKKNLKKEVYKRSCKYV